MPHWTYVYWNTSFHAAAAIVDVAPVPPLLTPVFAASSSVDCGLLSLRIQRHLLIVFYVTGVSELSRTFRRATTTQRPCRYRRPLLNYARLSHIMITDRPWEFQDDLEPRLLCDDSLDDDFLDAALQFLEQEDVVSDHDPHNVLIVETESNVVMTDDAQRPSVQHLRGIRSRSSMENEGSKPPVTTPRRGNKRRQEIETLRGQTKALEARLRMLKHKPETKISNDLGLFMMAPLGSTWEDVAVQEFEERERAEAENQRLKSLVKEHKRIARAFQEVAAQKMDLQAESLVTPHLQIPKDIGFTLQVPNVMEVLMSALRPMIEQTDEVLSSTLGRTLNTERHGDSHLTIQVQDARIVPVGVATTVSVMLEHALLRDDIKQLYWKRLGDDTYQSEFVTYSDFPGFRGQALGKLAVLRVEQANRTVIVRTSVFQCRCGRNRFLSLPMRHFLWTVIDRPPNIGLIPGEDSISRVRTCAISLPRLDVGDASDPSRDTEIDDLLQLCIGISTQQCDKAIDSMDKKLLGYPGSNARWHTHESFSTPIVQNAC